VGRGFSNQQNPGFTMSRSNLTRSEFRVIGAIAGAAVLIRFIPLFHSRMDFAFYLLDSHEFIQLNNGLIHGCGFARLINGACEPPELLRTPGYPVFLSVMPNLRALLAMQGLMAGAICFLIGSLMTQFWNFRAAIFSEAMVALDIASIVLADQIMSEEMFTLLLFLSVVTPLLLVSAPDRLTSRYLVATGCGLAAGLAILTRPIGIVLPLLLPIPFLFIRALDFRRRLAMAVVAFVLPTLAIVGWSARNYRVAGYFGLSTVPAINLYYYRAGAVIAHHDGISLTDAQDLLSRKRLVSYHQIYEARSQSSAIEKQLDVAAKNVLLTYPFQTLEVTMEGTLYNAIAPMRSELSAWLLIGSRESGLNSLNMTVGASRTLLRKLLSSPMIAFLAGIQLLTTLVLWVGLIVALWRSLRASYEYRVWCTYLAVIVVMFVGLAGGGEASQRFRVPVVPLLAIVAGLGFFGRVDCEEIETDKIEITPAR
jgi:hypothetical protein